MATSADPPAPPSPPLGTLIDNGAFELVELLGQGGYGIVYRALDTRLLVPTSYAVKCLPHAHASRSSRRRQLHIREIRLHKRASVHPNVVSLHRVVEDKDFTYIIMDYCEDGDLFTQILHQRRYLGQDELIKHVFLQLLDAVEYCHSIGIYHRDLKPENVLCFDGGLRLAITDFGLATVDTVSEEFRTGSAYHMSPECHGGPFAPSGSYSPLFNDVWSLGIILLNLLTGRNPWKSASLSDPTFYAYLQDPLHFLQTVLPISDEVNHLLIRTLEVNWRSRITLSEMKAIVKSIDNFYSEDVVFEGSMARCTWEVGMDIGSESCESQQPEVVEPTKPPAPVSRWSSESKSDSEMVFATHSPAESSLWRRSGSNDATCGVEASMRSSSLSTTFISPTKARPMQSTESSFSQSIWTIPSRSSSPSVESLPITPNDPSTQFSTKRLTINTTGCTTGYYRNSVTMKSDGSCSMYTAMESSSPSQTSCLFGSSTLCSQQSTHGFDDSDFISDTEMRDDLVKTPFTGADSAGEDSSSQSERGDSPILGLGLTLGVRNPKTIEDISEDSWRYPDMGSMHRTDNPWTSPHASGSQSSLMFNEKGAVGGFTFDQDLGFYGDDELESNPSWTKHWKLPVFSAPCQTNDSSLPPNSRTKPIDIPTPASSKPRLDRKRRKTGFFRDHIRLSFPRSSSSSVQREKTFISPPSPPTTNHQPLSSSLMAEEVTYGDTTGHTTTWARRGRFGGRLSSRTRKNWLLFSPGKLFGASA